MRYKIIEGSTSHHCCFEYSIVDTTKPLMIGDKHWESDGVKEYETICECFEREQAEKIVNALNKEEA